VAESDPETLRLIYEHVRGTPREQLRTEEVLDGKAERNLAVGAIALGLSGVTGIGDPGAASVYLIAAAGVAFIVLVWFVLRQLWPVQYRVVDDPPNTWNSQRGETPENFMHAIVWDAVASYQVNDDLNGWKAWQVRWQIMALAAEVVLVAAAAATAAASL
jgi:hypothetical protein